MTIKEVKKYLPDELIAILEKIYSTKQLDSIYRSYYKGRSVSFRVNNLKGKSNEVMEELMSKEIKVVNHPILKDVFIVKGEKDSALRKLEVYKYGKIYIQNISSMLPPLFLDLKENDVILDMCASPGGKSLYMADLTNNKAIILANDVNEVERERLNYNIEKQGASAIISFGSDACTIGKRLNKYFDKILLNAPCSGEGALKINSSQLLSNWSKEKVESSCKLQKRLFDSAYNALKPGGIMIYSTCTLNPYENEEIINYALTKYKDLSLEKIDIELSNIIRGLTSYDENTYNEELKKAIRIIPNEYMEGFFIAKIIKAKE